jgi:LysR family hca operon transcriptional activator
MERMELRHLRYFVAIAEEGSFSQAAEKRLHTAQPSLSRQISDLEITLRAQLIVRGRHGIRLTPAGEVFLQHARLILTQVEAATEAVRRAAEPTKTPFAVGFLTGHELEWLPRVLEILQADLQHLTLTIHSASTPELISALQGGRLDAAFVRPDAAAQGVDFKPLIEEELFAVIPATHRLARAKSVDARELAQEPFISFPPGYSPALRHVIDDYFAREGVQVTIVHEAETLPMVVSFAVSSGAVSLLPAYMRKLLPASVVARPLRGKVPTIPLAIGYNRNNMTPLLQTFLERIEGVAGS